MQTLKEIYRKKLENIVGEISKLRDEWKENAAVYNDLNKLVKMVCDEIKGLNQPG